MNAPQSNHLASRTLRLPQVLDLVGVSHQTIWRWERAGKFPKRFALGPNSVGWDEREVLEWLSSRPRGIAKGALA